MLGDLHIRKTCLMTKSFQLVRLETPQDRKRSVFAQQPVMQKQVSHRRVEKICDRVAMQVDYEDPASGDAAHLAKNGDCAVVIKVMQRQRLDDVIERISIEGKRKSVCLHRRNFGEVG